MTESSPDESSSKRKDFICGVVEGKKVVKNIFCVKTDVKRSCIIFTYVRLLCLSLRQSE